MTAFLGGRSFRRDGKGKSPGQYPGVISKLSYCNGADDGAFQKRRCNQTQGATRLTAATQLCGFQGQPRGERSPCGTAGSPGAFLQIGGSWAIPPAVPPEAGAEVAQVETVGRGEARPAQPSALRRPERPEASAKPSPSRGGRIPVQVGTSSVPTCRRRACAWPAAGVAGPGSPEMKAAAAAASQGSDRHPANKKPVLDPEEEERPSISLLLLRVL